MMWRDTISVGFIACRKDIKQVMEVAFSNETNVADFYAIAHRRAWFPYGVTIIRILDSKLFTKDMIVHQECRKGDRQGV